MRLLPMFVILSCLSLPQQAQACDQTPPPPVPCVQQLTCSFASLETQLLPTVNPLDNSSSLALAEIPAFLHYSLYNPDDQDCEEVQSVTLHFSSDCTDSA